MVEGVGAQPGDQLRRAVLAVTVTQDVDLLPTDAGLLVDGGPTVSWADCAHAAGTNPCSEAGLAGLARLVLSARWTAALPLPLLLEAVRVVGLPGGHALHPGPAWVRERVLGGCLEVGVGVLGLDPTRPDTVLPVSPAALGLRAADARLGQVWDRARRQLDTWADLAATRWAADRSGRLRPMGDADVVTLLASRRLRAALAAAETDRLATAVVPMLRRGWTALSRLDPAFGPAAAAATPPEERGFDRPLLLGKHEVVLVPAGGRPAEIVLRDPAAAREWSEGRRYSDLLT